MVAEIIRAMRCRPTLLENPLAGFREPCICAFLTSPGKTTFSTTCQSLNVCTILHQPDLPVIMNADPAFP
jgi:hypothetical protein